MNSIYIYHHLGLGDHIVCNGIIRHYAQSYDRVYVFCKPNNLKNVITMFKDDSKIRILAMDDASVRSFMKISPNNNYLIIGHEKLTQIMSNPKNKKSFDEIFYEMAHVPIQYKWEKFNYKRNIKKEQEVFYDAYGLKNNEKFAFIHETKERPVHKSINKDLRKVRPDNMEIEFFDYLFLIEKAQEVHVMNSSFMNLIDCIQLKNKGLFYHEYSRPNINAVLKMNWKTIK